MTKIILITITTPASENIGGTSALPYHLLIERDKDVEVEIYSYNINHLSSDKIKEVEDELNVNIHLLMMPRWLQWLFRFHLLFIRVFLKYPYLSYLKLSQNQIEEIKSLRPDGIWVYGEEIAGIMEQFPEYKRIHLGPDSEALYYYRMLGQRFVLRDWKMMQRQIIMYPKYVRLERKYVSDGNAVYFQVGDEDAKFVRNLNPNCHAVFLRHPHYDVKAEVNKEVKFHTPIRLLVAGQYNLYMKQSADELIDTLCSCHDIELKSSYEITFLGKGWEQHVMRLNQKGWHAKQIRFAPNYIEEIIKHDIQVTPITIGTGTKGKVLDAIANGLLVIGTPYAMENIAVEDGESCILYNCSAQVVDILEDIVHNIVRYEKMAEEGRKAVLKQHDRKTLSKQLLSFFN